MSEILLIQPCGFPIPNESRTISKILPYGLAIVHQALRSSGFKTKMIDLEAKLNYYEGLISDNEFEEWIYKNKQNEKIKTYLEKCLMLIPLESTTKIVAFSITYSFNFYYALALAAMIKNLFPQISICLGGAYFSIEIPERIIPDFIDYIIKGNGGPPMVHLCKHIYWGESIDHTGLWFRDNGDLVDKGYYYVESAEEEPPPDYTSLDINDYVVERPSVSLVKVDFKKYVVFPYRTHMGCTNACSFCSIRKYKASAKSAEKVYREIKDFAKLYPNVYIRFSDTAINNFPNSLNNILDLIIKNGLVINFHAAYAKMKNMSVELIEKMHKAGCREIIWGVEHFNPKIIKYYNKQYNVEEAENILKRCAELKIHSRICLIVNNPKETEKDFRILKKKVYKLLRYKITGYKIAPLILRSDSSMGRNPEKYGMKKVEKSDSNPDFLNKIGWMPIDMPLEQFTKVWLKREMQRQKLQSVLNRMSILYMNKIYLPVQVVIVLVNIKWIMRNIKNRIFSVLS